MMLFQKSSKGPPPPGQYRAQCTILSRNLPPPSRYLRRRSTPSSTLTNIIIISSSSNSSSNNSNCFRPLTRPKMPTNNSRRLTLTCDSSSSRTFHIHYYLSASTLLCQTAFSKIQRCFFT